MPTKTYPTLDPSTVVVETASHWLQMPTEYDPEEVTDEDIAHDGVIVDLSSAVHGWLIDCRTGKFLRPATCAESDAGDDADRLRSSVRKIKD
jgi:nitrite reductase/ring-hydroxylating ferredoxin subunit